jgi:hypothetical protein
MLRLLDPRDCIRHRTAKIPRFSLSGFRVTQEVGIPHLLQIHESVLVGFRHSGRTLIRARVSLAIRRAEDRPLTGRLAQFTRPGGLNSSYIGETSDDLILICGSSRDIRFPWTAASSADSAPVKSRTHVSGNRALMRPPTEPDPVERQNDDSRAAATRGSRSSATLRTSLTVIRRSDENPRIR